MNVPLSPLQAIAPTPPTVVPMVVGQENVGESWFMATANFRLTVSTALVTKTASFEDHVKIIR